MYEYQDIVDYLTNEFTHIGDTPKETELMRNTPTKRKRGINFSIGLVKTTLQTKLYSNYTIDFTVDGSLGSILGFERVILQPKTTYLSTKVIRITNVNVIRVECNIAQGAYLNGKRTHSIYNFYPKVGLGYKIIEQPLPMIYYPIALQSINTITVVLRDQSGNKINLRKEHLSVTLHIRALQ